MKYKPRCTNLLVVVMIQFINSCLVFVYNKACGGDDGQTLQKMYTCPINFRKKKITCQKYSPKQTYDKRKWKTNVNKWGLQVQKMGTMGESKGR